MKVVPEVLDSLVGEVPVVVPPGKLFLDVASGLQRLQSLHDVKVGDFLKLCNEITIS